MEAKLYTTKQARELLGLKPSELRYMIRRGLVPNVRRFGNGRIALNDAQLDWLQALIGLRRAGFTNADLRQYTWLCRKGQSTLPQRKAMVETKRQQAWQELEECQKRVDILTRKEDYLEQILTKKIPMPASWV